MSKFFSKAMNAFSFGSSQLNGSSMNDSETMAESPFRSSQSYLSTKSKSSKKRKSMEENSGSGKKKSKKHRPSFDEDQEFEGFGDLFADDNTHENSATSIPHLNGINGEEDVEISAKKSKNAARKRKDKKGKAVENGVQDDSAMEQPEASLPVTSLRDEGVLETPISKKEKRRKLRHSLESSHQTNGTGLEDLEQLSHEDANNTTPGPSFLNGLSAGSETKSKKKKKVKKSALIAEPDVGLPTKDQETGAEVAALSPSVSHSKKKKSKKNRKSGLALEHAMVPSPFDDEPDIATNGHVEEAEATREEIIHEGRQESSPDAPLTQRRKDVKKEKSSDEATDTLGENVADAHEENQVKPRKSKKHKKRHERSRDEVSANLGIDSLISNHHVASFNNDSNSLQEPEQVNELYARKHVNGAIHDSPEPEPILDAIVPQSGEKKRKRSKRKSTASAAVDKDDDASRVETPEIASQAQKTSKLQSTESKPLVVVAALSLGEASNAQLNAVSSKSKKSRHRKRESAFKESFGQLEDEASDGMLRNSLPVDSIQPAPSPVPPTINRAAVINPPSQIIGIYGVDGSKAAKSGKSRKLSSEEKESQAEGLEDSTETIPPRNPGVSTLEDSDEHDVLKTPSAGSKRKRVTKTADEANPEALRLPVKKRRTRKPAARSTEEEREVNPEALRLPKKKSARKSTAKKPTRSTTEASASSGAASRKGAFSEEEIAKMENVLVKFGEAYDLTESAVREIVQANARTNEKTSGLLNELSAALPDRPHAAVVKVARRKFHNFPRYGKWTEEEDEELKEAFRLHGNSWVKIASELNRHQEDVRDRWRNYVVCGAKLDKGPWTKDEEEEMMDKIEIRLNNIRNAWGPEEYEDQLKRGITDYELIDWALISKDMGSTRSRLQCQAKYKQLADRKAPGEPRAREDPETKSWRTTKGKAEVTFMKPGDKYMILRGIQRAGYGREEKINFRKIGDQALKDSFTDKAKKLALKFMRRDIPGGEDMTLQEMVAQAIENLENEYAGDGRLTQRYDPDVDGETYPTRKRRSSKKATSGRRVTKSDDEDSDSESSADDSEEPKPQKKSKLRDRMERYTVSDEDSEDVAQKPRSNRSKNRTTLVEEKEDDEMDVDQPHDTEEESEDGVQERQETKSEERTMLVEEENDDQMDVDQDQGIEMLDNNSRVDEDSTSRSPSPSQTHEEQPEIADSDDGGNGLSSSRLYRHTSEEELDVEVGAGVQEVSDEEQGGEQEVSDGENGDEQEVSDVDAEEEPELHHVDDEEEPELNDEDHLHHDEEQDDARSTDGAVSHESPIHQNETLESLNNVEANAASVDDEESNERARVGSPTISRGREFRLGGRVTNLQDVEISSDDSMEDIPAVRPVTRAGRMSSKKDTGMVKRRLRSAAKK